MINKWLIIVDNGSTTYDFTHVKIWLYYKNTYIYFILRIGIKTKTDLRLSWGIDSERRNNRENIKSMHMDITINVL